MARIATQVPDEVKRKLDSLKQPKETTAELLARLCGAQEQVIFAPAILLDFGQKLGYRYSSYSISC